jgi:hypothetical protein
VRLQAQHKPLPKLEDVVPNAGVDDAPKAGVELPNGEDDGVPNAGVDGWPKPPVDAAPNAGVDVAPKAGADGWPKAPAEEVAPNGEVAPVCAPKAGVGLPKGLLAGVLVWPNPPDWAPKGLLEVCPKAPADDCPKGLVEPNMAAAVMAAAEEGFGGGGGGGFGGAGGGVLLLPLSRQPLEIEVFSPGGPRRIVLVAVAG